MKAQTHHSSIFIKFFKLNAVLLIKNTLIKMVESVNNLNRFLARHKENADMNQYWYSKPTIDFMAKEVEQLCAGSETVDPKKAAFLSTPSIYFSLKDKTVKANSKVFDVSQQQTSFISFIF